MKKVFITGISGFTGKHLFKLLNSKNYQIYGIYNKSKLFENNPNSFQCDINDSKKLLNIIKKVKPDIIYHLAGVTYAPDPSKFEIFYKSFIMGTLNLLETVKNLEIDPIILITGSALEYGLISNQTDSIGEDCSIHPISHYGISKVTQSSIAYLYFKKYNLKIIRTRTFNILGPEQSENSVCSSFAKQIAKIEATRDNNNLLVGNLEAKRDFVDVRDVVEAYELLCEKGVIGEIYNVCSGKCFSIKEILNILLQFTNIEVDVKVNNKKFRKLDIPIQIGDNKKIKQSTGWEPKIPIEKSLEDLLNWWRVYFKKEGER